MDQQTILQIGTSINIKRTDGRVHSAIVAAINFDQKSATVEWFEQGETKGKEIDMNAIESLNPEIVIRRAIDHPRLTEVPQLNETAASNQLQRDASGSSDEDTTLGMTSLQNSQKGDENDDFYNCNQYTSGNSTMPNPTRQSIASFRGHDGNTRSALPRRNPTLHLPNNGHTAANDVVVVPEETTNTRTNVQVQNSRRGKVVQEVEKLKKNREERRQRQAEEKAEKEAFLQMAPGNPHWELLNMIMEYRRSLDIKPLSENDVIEDHLITVCVRKRPLNKREAAKKEVDVITIPSKNQLIVHEPKLKVDLTKYLENQLFRFDYAFDESCTNDMVYRYTAQPLIKTIFEGGFATCFAYGQTGSGKTHTMGGDFNGKNQDCHKGIYAMASADVFKYIHSTKYRDLNLLVSASFFEIYSGKVFDLLNNKAKLRILEDGKQQVVVVGLTEKVVHNTDEVLKLIQKGNQARTSGQTFANSNSSRSHAVFQIYIRKSNNPTGIHGKFSLIDLAGNERGADTSSADRQTRMEGAEINKSLLALKECIRALGRKGSHLPFRVSKLTQVLRDSFVGSNSRTCMIAMVSPGIHSCEHTLNTLRYADRVKELGGGDLQTLSEEQGNGDDDLQRLRSLSENDMTPEMLNFHEVISQLQEAEELMLDNHKNTLEELINTYEKGNALFGTTTKPYYDSEAYCAKWEQLMSNISNVAAKTVELTENYKAKMTAEEQLSRSTKKK